MTQTIIQYNRMLYMREYRKKVRENPTFWIKRSKIIF